MKESDFQNPDDFKALCHKLKNWDNGEKFVGTAIAREFNIKGTEAGHKIKLLALQLEANIPGLEIATKSKSSLKKYQKSDISMPAPPTCKRMKVEERKLIETNVISVGFPCCPLPVTYYTNGEKYEKEAMGRKYSLRRYVMSSSGHKQKWPSKPKERFNSEILHEQFHKWSL